MSLPLEVVRELAQLRRLPEPVLERALEEPVREPGVPRQERAVEVRSDRRSDAAPLEAALAVVAEAGEDATEWRCLRVEPRDSRMVLEAGDGAPVSRHEVALDQTVADHAPFAGHGVEREQAGAGLLVAAAVAIEAPQELVAAAHRQRGGSRGDRRLDCLALRGQVRRDQRLLPILAAADVEEVVHVRAQLVADAHGLHAELEPTPR